MMQIHQLQPKYKFKKRKRVGRGGSHGTYSGRGIKGQSSRAGRKFQPVIRELIKRYPKLRGYRFRFKIQSSKFKIVNLGVLEKNFEAGQNVNPRGLLEKRLIRRIKGKAPSVKILGGGELTKALIIKNCLVSRKAKEAVEKVHGLVK